MQQTTVKANENNDLKYRQGLSNDFIPGGRSMPADGVIPLKEKKEEDEIEYITE